MVSWLKVSDIPMSGYALVIIVRTLDAYSWIDSLELFLVLLRLALTVSAGVRWENLSLNDIENIIRSSLISGPNVAAKFNASSFKQKKQLLPLLFLWPIVTSSHQLELKPKSFPFIVSPRKCWKIWTRFIIEQKLRYSWHL